RERGQRARTRIGVHHQQVNRVGAHIKHAKPHTSKLPCPGAITRGVPDENREQSFSGESALVPAEPAPDPPSWSEWTVRPTRRCPPRRGPIRPGPDRQARSGGGRPGRPTG